MYNKEELDKLAMLFKLFDDSTRLSILNTLMDGEKCVNDISLVLKMSQSSISHQLKILKQGDLVRDRKEGKNVFYSIKDDHVKTIISIGIEHILER